MAYAVARIYSGSTATEQLAEIALKELAPKLAARGGLVRYSTFVFSDGRIGSFSVYESQDAAKGTSHIAAELVGGHNAFKGIKLDETMEGEVIYAAEGTAKSTGRMHGVGRIYETKASTSDIKGAFENEGPAALSTFVGLVRYAVVKMIDGRVGTFGSFDTPDNAKKSSEGARKVRSTSASQIGRCLPSDPQIMEGTIVGVYQA